MIELAIVFNEFNGVIEYNYYRKLHGFICKLIGNDNYNSRKNDYIYTNLLNSEFTNDGIIFCGNPYVIIRTNNHKVIENLRNNFSFNKKAFDGLTLNSISDFTLNHEKSLFKTAKVSPILVSKKYEWKDVLSKDEIIESENYLVNNLKTKANELGFKLDDNLSIKIVRQHNHKDIMYNGVVNKGRVFELIIQANNETKEFILLNGLGRSCGCGFGFIF